MTCSKSKTFFANAAKILCVLLINFLCMPAISEVTSDEEPPSHGQSAVRVVPFEETITGGINARGRNTETHTASNNQTSLCDEYVPAVICGGGTVVAFIFFAVNSFYRWV